MARIFVSAGHSNTDPGASGNGLTEAGVVTDFRNLVGFYLARAKVDFDTDGTGLQNLALKYAMAQAKKATVAVEFHCNAGPPTATGCEVLSSDADKPLADILSGTIAKTLGIKNRGAKAEGSGQHHRLGFVQSGGLIVELFFISNLKDCNAYAAKKWLLASEVARVLIAAAAAKQ